METRANCGCDKSGDLAPAGIIGRAGKLLVGAVQLYFVYFLLSGTELLGSAQAPDGAGLWIGAALAFSLLPWTLNLGFNRKWGKWPLAAVGTLAVLAAAFDSVAYGHPWGLPLALLVFVVSAYVHVHMGVSHVLAGIVATPGCEMRTFSYLRAKFSDREAQLRVCPGWWGRLDKWEAAWRENIKAGDKEVVS